MKRFLAVGLVRLFAAVAPAALIATPAVAVSGCTQAQIKSAGDFVIDEAAAACVVAHADLTDPEVIALCAGDALIGPLVKQAWDALLSSTRAAKAAARQADAGAPASSK